MRKISMTLAVLGMTSIFAGTPITEAWSQGADVNTDVTGGPGGASGTGSGDTPGGAAGGGSGTPGPGGPSGGGSGDTPND